MGTLTFQEGPALVTSSGVTTPSRTIATKVLDIHLQVTSTSFDAFNTSTAYDWVQKANTGAFHFGIEYSSDSGATWRWVVHGPGDGAPPEQLPIGLYSGKAGQMPEVGAGPSILKTIAGSRARVRAFTIPVSTAVMPLAVASPTVRVGAIITVLTDT